MIKKRTLGTFLFGIGLPLLSLTPSNANAESVRLNFDQITCILENRSSLGKVNGLVVIAMAFCPENPFYEWNAEVLAENSGTGTSKTLFMSPSRAICLINALTQISQTEDGSGTNATYEVKLDC